MASHYSTPRSNKHWLPFTAIAASLVVLCITDNIAQQQTTRLNQSVVVGFLEDDRKEIVNWQPIVSSRRLVRPAFIAKNQSWSVIGDLDQKVIWTVAFDGRKLAEVRSAPDVEQRGKDSHESDFNGRTHLVLTSATSLPNIGEPSTKFAGTMFPGKVRRPLVLVSKPNFSDPDGWKPTQPSEAIAKLVRNAFRREFPHVDRFKHEEVIERDWKFSDSGLSLPAVYASNKGSFLIKTQLKAESAYVDDPNDPYADPWFFVSPNHDARRIGAFMELLDAGDYDADGHSEVIFFLGQPEDEDGYILFYDNFRQSVRLTWSYH